MLTTSNLQWQSWSPMATLWAMQGAFLYYNEEGSEENLM